MNNQLINYISIKQIFFNTKFKQNLIPETGALERAEIDNSVSALI